MRMLHDDDLLDDSRLSEAFSQVNRKRPARERPLAANPAKRSSACGDFWCWLVLACLTFGSYGYFSVPAQDRTLAKFESKLRFLQRALGGETEEENRRLTSALAVERQNEVTLRGTENALQREVKAAQEAQSTLQRRLNSEESRYKSVQQDAKKARNGLQTWHRKSDTLQSRLALIQKDDTKKQSDLQRSHQEAVGAEQHVRQLERSLVESQKKITGLGVTAKNLRAQVQHQEHSRQDTVTKLRRYREAEKALMKSIGIDN